MPNEDEPTGCLNPSADAIKRIDGMDVYGMNDDLTNWKGQRIPPEHNYERAFFRLKCTKCGGTDCFEVLYTAEYETAAMCTRCRLYYAVHSG